MEGSVGPAVPDDSDSGLDFIFHLGQSSCERLFGLVNYLAEILAILSHSQILLTPLDEQYLL
jgi:hypothetical protein